LALLRDYNRGGKKRGLFIDDSDGHPRFLESLSKTRERGKGAASNKST